MLESQQHVAQHSIDLLPPSLAFPRSLALAASSQISQLRKFTPWRTASRCSAWSARDLDWARSGGNEAYRKAGGIGRRLRRGSVLQTRSAGTDKA